MGLKEIIEALEKECEGTVKEIEERALVQAQRIRDEAAERAERASEELVQAEKKKIALEARNIINDAQAKARRIIAEARDETFKLIYQEIKSQIENNPEIAEVLYGIALEDALQNLNGKSREAVLVASKRDRSLIEKLARSMGLSVSESNGIKSGFVLNSENGKVSFVVNPEIIAERITRLYLAEIAKRLFE